MNHREIEAYAKVLGRGFPEASPEALRRAAELCLAWDEGDDDEYPDFPELIRQGHLLVEGLEEQ